MSSVGRVFRRKYAYFAAIGLLAFAMWFATHTQDAQGSGEEAETGGTRLILISHDAPDWREQLEQALIDVGTPGSGCRTSAHRAAATAQRSRELRLTSPACAGS